MKFNPKYYKSSQDGLEIYYIIMNNEEKEMVTKYGKTDDPAMEFEWSSNWKSKLISMKSSDPIFKDMKRFAITAYLEDK